MDRREFIGTAGVLAGGALLKDLPGLAAATERPLDLAAFHAERRYASTGYGRIAYVERGGGKAALFLHGFPLNGFQWRGALERPQVRKNDQARGPWC